MSRSSVLSMVMVSVMVAGPAGAQQVSPSVKYVRTLENMLCDVLQPSLNSYRKTFSLVLQSLEVTETAFIQVAMEGPDDVPEAPVRSFAQEMLNMRDGVSSALDLLRVQDPLVYKVCEEIGKLQALRDSGRSEE